MSTIQLDFQLPQRFGLEYVGSDNARHRPVMIHRALFGSVERFLAILLEHYAGALPTWLMPEQVRVLPVKEDIEPYAETVVARLAEAGLRVSLDSADTGVGPRVGKAKVQKIPYVLVVGDSDAAAGTVGVNRRGAKDPERDVPLDRFVAEVTDEVAAHSAGPQPEAVEPGS
jgi:threonyl-tRNA synthetase